MSGIYKKLLASALVVIIVCTYLIGVNLIKRIDRVDDIKDSVPITKTEQEAETELGDTVNKININTATMSELTKLGGVGETLAKRIIARREETGIYTSIDQLLEIDGLGEAKFNTIAPFVTVD